MNIGQMHYGPQELTNCSTRWLVRETTQEKGVRGSVMMKVATFQKTDHPQKFRGMTRTLSPNGAYDRI